MYHEWPEDVDDERACGKATVTFRARAGSSYDGSNIRATNLLSLDFLLLSTKS